MSRLARTAPVRGILALLVRVLRSPAVRRRLLPLLFPGRTTGTNGRVSSEEWKVPAPVLGDHCVPGCDDPLVDWDGVHYCKVAIGHLDHMPSSTGGDDHGFVVEVTQTQGEPRRVWLLELDRDGGYASDGMQLTPAAAAALSALLDTAFVVAEQAPTARRTVGGAR
jgi:hypothetical protein